MSAHDLSSAPEPVGEPPASRFADRRPLPPPVQRRDMPRSPRRERSGCLIAGVVVLVALAAVAALAFVALAKITEAMAGAVPTWSAGMETRIIEETVADGDGTSDQKIAVIEVRGIIVSDAPFDAAGARRIVQELDAAQRDEQVVAVILDMNTPGGEVTASDEIHQAVQRFRATNRPVLTCMRALGASGGYLIAAGTDRIIAHRLTQTGSIGVIVGSLNYAGFLDEHGFRIETYKSGSMKDFLAGSRTRTEAEIALANELVQANFLALVEIVAAGRPHLGTVADILAAPYADGRILTGRQAREFGLVDAEGYFEDAVADARALAGAPHARVVRFRRRTRFADFLFTAQTESRMTLRTLLGGPEAALIKPGLMYYLMPSVLP